MYTGLVTEYKYGSLNFIVPGAEESLHVLEETEGVEVVVTKPEVIPNVVHG